MNFIVPICDHALGDNAHLVRLSVYSALAAWL